MFLSCRNLTVIPLLLVLVALMPGCGRKTALVPPQELVPVAIKDLRYFLDESGVSLEWTYPEKMVNGDELPAIEKFEVLRAEILQEEFCEGCPLKFTKKVLVDGGSLPETGKRRTAEYNETDLQEGYRYFYKVRSRTGWWYPSSDSNIISFTWKSSLHENLPAGE